MDDHQLLAALTVVRFARQLKFTSKLSLDEIFERLEAQLQCEIGNEQAQKTKLAELAGRKRPAAQE